MRLLFSPGNPHKAAELQAMADAMGPGRVGLGSRWCRRPWSEADAPRRRGHGSFEGNARKKAQALRGRSARGRLGPADDSGLCVDARGGAPGVDSAYYAGPQADPAANLAKLVEAMREVPDGAGGPSLSASSTWRVPGPRAGLHGALPGHPRP